MPIHRPKNHKHAGEVKYYSVFIKKYVKNNEETVKACETRCMQTFLFYKSGFKVREILGAKF